MSDTTNNRRRRRMDREVTETPRKKRISFISILLVIELIAMFFLYKFIGLGLVTILLIPLILYVIINIVKSKKGLKRPKGTVFVFIIYLILTVVGLRTFGVLGNLVSSEQVNEFHVIARSDDAANSLDDIADGSYMALGSETSYTTNIYPQSVFADEGYNFTYTTYESEVDAVSDLLNGTINYAVVADPSSEELESNFDGLDSQIKELDSYREKVQIQTGNKNVSKETFTVLLTGVDSRSDSIDSNSRSDSIMVAKVDPKNGKAAIVSIPRDAYITSTCTGSSDKITHSSVNGMNCLISDVENLLGVSIDYYLKVNFFAVIDAIDAVGGIDVDVEQSFCGQDEYDNANAYCFEPGSTHMTGSEALSYARERHAFSDGDYARARHQQQVISGFLNALITSGPFAINNLLDVASSSARTNMSQDQLVDLAKLLQSQGDFEMNSYTISGYGSTVDLPYWGLYGSSVQVLDDSSIAEAKSMLDSI